MAHTTAIVGSPPYKVVGDQKEVIADITQSTVYATGGEAVTASELGLSIIESADANFVTTVATATGVDVAPVVAANGSSMNLKANTAAGEVANGAGFINTVMRVRVRGRGGG